MTLQIEARELFRRLNAEHQGWADGHPRKIRLGRIKYRAWRRWMRRVDTDLKAHGLGYIDDIPPIFGQRAWRDV